jgi:hypothetical protein
LPLEAAVNQIPLNFDTVPAPFQRRSPTSQAAALAVEPRSGTLRAMVLSFLRGRGATGATDEEIQLRVPMNANTERPRRVELVRGGFILDSGRTRPTVSGDEAVVWVASEWAHTGGT